MSIPTKPRRPRPVQGSGERRTPPLCPGCDRIALAMGVFRGREHYYCVHCEAVYPMLNAQGAGGDR